MLICENTVSSSVQFSLVTQSCPTLCDPMNCSTPGFHHQLLESTQTHVHWVSDAIQLSPSPPTFNLSQHQGLFQWVSSSYQVAKILELQLQYQSFQWLFKTDFQRFMKSWFSTKSVDQHTVHPKTLSSIRICSELQAHLSSPRKRLYCTQCLLKQVISFFRSASPGLLLAVKGITDVSLSNSHPGPHSPPHIPCLVHSQILLAPLSQRWRASEG